MKKIIYPLLVLSFLAIVAYNFNVEEQIVGKQEISNNLKLKADKSKIVKSRDINSTELEYAYETTEIVDNEKSDAVIAKANKDGLQVGNEIVSKRTMTSKHYEAGDKIVTEFTSGGAPYYKEGDKWFNLKYATTTKDAFGKQVSLITKIKNYLAPDVWATDFTTSVDNNTAKTYSLSAGQVWSTIIAAAGNLVGGADPYIYSFAYIGSDGNTYTNKWRQLYRSHFAWDTSSIGAGRQVDSASFYVYGYGKADDLAITPTFNVYNSTGTFTTTLAATDHVKVGTTAYSTAKSYSSLNNSESSPAENEFAFNADGKSAINMTGTTRFCGREATYDVGGSTPDWHASKTSWWVIWTYPKGVTYQAKLVVTHSAAGGGTVTPPDDGLIIFE